MSYSLNNILLSDYGIAAGQASGGNIAVTGCFDLPSRLGETYKEWDDDQGVEPYVESGDIYFSGRDITFHGIIPGNRDKAVSCVSRLKLAINNYTDLVEFVSPYGNFNVKVKDIKVTHEWGASLVTIQMREPQHDYSEGVLPAQSSALYVADGIPLESFGFYITKVTGKTDLPGGKKENFTVYGKEGYQITPRKANNVNIEGIVVASNMADFISKIKALWKLFSNSGLRKMRLTDYITIEAFATEGFSVTNVSLTDLQVVAQISLKTIAVAEFILVIANEQNKLFASNNDKILVYG